MAREALTIIGTVVGAYFGNPQLGYAIGSMVGNAVDPVVINGPRIGDAARQTTTEGVPRPIPYGRVLYSATVLEIGDLVKRYREEGGKGGEPVVKQEYLYRTFVYGFGEGPIDGYSLIKMDGTVVYDTRPGSTLGAASYEFAKKFRFYRGDETHVGDPALEAIHGVGNTAVYRGTPHFVFELYDVTGREGTIPVIEVEVIREGTIGADGGGWITGPVAVNGAAGGSQAYYLQAPTLEDLPFATPKPIPAWVGSQLGRLSKANGAIFMHPTNAGSGDAAVSFDRGITWVQTNADLVTAEQDVTWNGNYYYQGLQRSVDGITWSAIPGLPAGTDYVVAREFFNNPIVAVDTSGFIHLSYDDGGTWQTFARGAAISYMTGGKLLWRWTENSTQGRFSDDDFATVQAEAGSSVKYRPFYSDDFQDNWIRKSFSNKLIWQEDTTVDWADTLYISTGAVADNTVAWGDFTWVALRIVAGSPIQHYININREGGEPDDPILGPRWTELADPIYGNGGNIVWAGEPTYGEATPGTLSLQYILEDICDRCTMIADEYDASEQAAINVSGLLLANVFTGVAAIRSITPAYFFDVAWMDGKVHFVQRGKPVKGTIYKTRPSDGNSDLLDEPVYTKRGYPREYAKKLHMGYQSAETNYTPTKATSARDSSDVRVTGERSFEVPVVLTSDEAARIVDINHKIAFTEAEGDIILSLGEEFLGITPTDCYYFDDGVTVERIRVEETDYADGVIKITAKFDREVNYSSTAVGPVLPGPSSPPRDLAPQTVFAMLNIAALTETDDMLGYRVGVGMPQTGWPGTQVQRSADDGVSYTDVLTTNVPSVIGTLLEAVPARSQYYTDHTSVVRVKLPYGAFESRTDLEWLQQGGGIAITRLDGTAELLQFRDSVDEGGGVYALSMLLRGRNGSDSSIAHLPGAKVVLLSTSKFILGSPSLLGLDVQHRAVTLNTSPEKAVVYKHSLETLHAQEEHAVSHLRAKRSAANVITAQWCGRGRFGNSIWPVHSVNFMGFQITIIKGATTITLPPQVGNSVSYDATALGAGVTVRVQQINRFTGPGPATEITV